jgi:hypothetical protein
VFLVEQFDVSVHHRAHVGLGLLVSEVGQWADYRYPFVLGGCVFGSRLLKGKKVKYLDGLFV